MGLPIIQINNVTKSFETKDSRVEALKGISLEINRGDIYGIIGMSGAGKSTLVRCLNFLEKPTEGTVLIEGQDLSSCSDKELRKVRNSVAMIFQHFNLLMQRTVLDNVCFSLEILGMKKKEAREKALGILKIVDLEEKTNAYPAQLSGGQKQRVGIARALVQDPLLMLADEPIASLDPKSSRTVMEHLRWAADELGVACLANLHQVDFAMEFSDRIVALKKGRVVFDGAPHLLDEAAIADIYGTNEEAEAGSDFGERSVRQVGELSSSRTREADPERLGKAEAKASSSPEVAA